MHSEEIIESIEGSYDHHLSTYFLNIFGILFLHALFTS